LRKNELIKINKTKSNNQKVRFIDGSNDLKMSNGILNDRDIHIFVDRERFQMPGHSGACFPYFFSIFVVAIDELNLLNFLFPYLLLIRRDDTDILSTGTDHTDV